MVIEGTDDAPRHGPRRGWREYEFKGKPGDPRRRPPQVAPYHLRLDWLMWFAALSPGYAEPWLPRLLDGLLAGDPDMLRLLRANPFPGAPPALRPGPPLPLPVHHLAAAAAERRLVGADPACVFQGPVTLRPRRAGPPGLRGNGAGRGTRIRSG